ncbi:MFS transporter [Actinoallomurus iriomotensis]|uniref:MFS transporter n=1 Tax=Actinoallomurus iriomotensis TaxID=478107 RepID=A0A9W6S3W0_9ACTN|nr:MFS transporter [Actinoallomurus iriomotensis]GLY86746.1 MFS transporter [Actinoallomurus iriomotensis]
MPQETGTAVERATGPRPPRRVLIGLCATEITSWGVLYYAFPVTLSSLTRDTGWSTATAMAAFSAGAVVSALAGILVGRLIDARGPRPVMTAGSVVGVAAVVAIAAAPSLPLFFAAWVLAGLAQSAVLYQPAFTALTGWYGPARVRALTAVTLAGGFASTVFAPLTALLLDHLTWRGTYLALAVILGVVTVPLHALCLTPPWRHGRTRGAPNERDAHARAVVRSRPFAVLTAAMTCAAFGCYAATVNLVPLLTSGGMGTHLAAVALGLCGAGQVLGRLGYPRLAARTAPPGRAAAILTAGAVTVAVLGVLRGPGAVVVAVLAGAARGMFTLLQATTIADRWGTRAFGHVNGVFTAPITVAIALAPGGGALLARLTGGYPVSYCVLAALTLAAAVAIRQTGTS